MTYNQKWERNNYKVQCDICGLVRKRSQCRLTWDGLLACVSEPGCWYPKHPFDCPPPVMRDSRPVRDARPVSSNYTFVTLGQNWESIFTRWEDLSSSLSHKWEQLT